MIKQISQALYICLFIFLLSACNVVRTYHKFLDRRFTKHFDHTQYIELNNSKVFCQYSIADTTKPYLLLLHGFGVDGRLTLFQHYRAFSRKYNVIIPDMPSFGKSLNHSNNYSVYHAAHTIKLLIDTLKIPKQKLYICGLSFGGLIAALVNKEVEGEIAGIILNCTPIKHFDIKHFVNDKSKYKVANGMELILPQTPRALNELFKAGSTYPLFIPTFIKRQVLNDIFLPNRDEKVKVIQSIMDEAEQLQTDDYGFNLQKHIAIIAGSKDDLIPPSVADSLKLTIAKHAEFKIFKGESHNLISEAQFKWHRWVDQVLEKWELERLGNTSK
jgi:pimeloyl-ACP methyl ester carboxylesterase